jgi:hypothetical protein
MSETLRVRAAIAGPALIAALPLLGACESGRKPAEPAAAPAAADATPASLAIRRRAAEAFVWALPAVNTDLMLDAARRIGVGDNEIVYWPRPADWKNQTLTPNPDAIYFMVFFNTKDVGPVVIEVPPAAGDNSFTGNIDDLWQMALEDAGPSGADAGKGGKYLVLPPDYKGKPPQGYIALPSYTYSGYALMRSSLKSRGDADVASATEYAKRLKVYALRDAAHPPPTKMTDGSTEVYDATIPADIRYFESLDRVVQREPWLERDRAMIDVLKTLGIERGKPFSPDAGTKAALEAGAREAHAWLDGQLDTAFAPYWEGARWVLPAQPELIEVASQNRYVDAARYPVDARALTYSMGYVGIKRLGAGQFYLMTMLDKDGNAFEGGTTYRLRVPPDAPMKQYWSATVYDRETHALVRNMTVASRSSNRSDIRKNEDGSVDVYFGPKAPAGQETNWVQTDPQRRFEIMFRLYGPTEALFKKSWKLPDVDKVNP